jgi:predicted O-linked N-acetylglucosamine transferase (SPINDLY family)
MRQDQNAFDLGIRFYEAGRYDEAEQTFRLLVHDDEHNPRAWLVLGLINQARGNLDEAVRAYREAARRDPTNPDVQNNLGVALVELGRLDEAIICLTGASRLEPDNPRPLNNLALAFARQGRWGDSAGAAARAAELDPAMPEALNNLGLAHIRLLEPEEAVGFLERALSLRPQFPEALNNLGWALIMAGRHEAALAQLRAGLELRPDDPDALNNLGLALNECGRREEAAAAYEHAVRVRPRFAEALGGLGNIYSSLGRMHEALDYYRRAVAIDPGLSATSSNMLFTMHYHPDLTPEEIFREHQNWARHNTRDLTERPRPHYPNVPDPERRLRVGYLSSDFKAHVVSAFAELILGCRDRERFEVFGYANVLRPDSTTERLKGLADHWRDVTRLTDEQVVEQVRADGIDVLIDLTGHTSGGNRLRVFAAGPAPVQATHFGYMETTGLPTMDYRITDAVCDPPGMTEHVHTERLVRLPVVWTYRANASAELNELPALTTGRSREVRKQPDPSRSPPHPRRNHPPSPC